MLLRDIVYALNLSLPAYPHDHKVVVEEFLKEMHRHRKPGNLSEVEQSVTDRLVEVARIYLASPAAARLAALQTAAETAEKFYDGRLSGKAEKE